MRLALLALSVSAVSCHPGSSSTASAAPASATNLGLGANGIYGAGPLMVVNESERLEGRDLNGDGDALDEVLAILDLDAGSVTRTGLVMAQGIPRGDFVPKPLLSEDATPTLAVDEFASGRGDLDGDGDAFDLVLFRYDRDRRELVNLGLPASSVFSNGEFLAFDAAGNLPRDLDGDGSFDLFPGRPSVLELASGVTFSTGLAAARILSFAGDSLALAVDEARVGDRNGDLDEHDLVLELYDVRQRVSRPIDLALTLTFGRPIRPIGDGRCWVADIWEAAEGGRDLNGDGDALDRVLHVFDAHSGALVRILDELNLLDRDTSGGLLALTGPREGGRGGRIWLYSMERDLLEDTGFAGNSLVRRDLDVALLVDEQAQGEDLDANGVLTSVVTVLYEPGSGRTHNLAVDGEPMARPGGLLLLSFEGSAERDWNGDGDQEDLVPFVWNEGDARPRSSALAVVFARPMDDTHALVLLDEHEQDRNGDGDQLDDVAAVLDLRRGHQTNLGLAGALTFPLDGPARLLLVAESSQGSDLNGDGDLLDNVPYRIAPGP